MTIHTTQSHHGDRPIEVYYHPDQEDPGYEVQVFLGTSYASLYMDVDTARAFAEQILAVVPAPVEVTEPTLGDIYTAMRSLMERGVTVESIRWVTENQLATT